MIKNNQLNKNFFRTLVLGVGNKKIYPKNFFIENNNFILKKLNSIQLKI